MKKYEIGELKECLDLLLGLSDLSQNAIIADFTEKIKEEIEKQGKHFIKASDEYLRTLKTEDVYMRRLETTDKYYYKGMYGLFEKKTDTLLRRHTDTGFLNLPYEVDRRY